jgi:toxin ParE1/3/4
MRLVWSAPALAHLDSIRQYIEQDSSPHYAERFVQRLLLAPERLAAFPESGRVVPEGDGRHREVIERSYRVIYRLGREVVYIVAVVHGSRDLNASLISEIDQDR